MKATCVALEGYRVVELSRLNCAGLTDEVVVNEEDLTDAGLASS